MARRIEELIAKHDSATAARAPVLSYEPAPPRSAARGGWILALLTLSTTAAAAVMYYQGATTLLEAISFVSGAVCVWLTVRENVWNFPIGLLNVATFAVVFFHARLFADASLQIVYVVLTLIGWYLWLYGGERRTTLHVTRTSKVEAIIVALVGAMLTLACWRTLRLIGGSASFWDALTTALSLCAQWLLNRKRLENWHVWMAADLIYVPLYAYKGLYLTSVLYAAFFGMCVVGLAEWRATHRRLQAGGAA